MRESQKIKWEFNVDRAYLPLSCSLNIYINNKKSLKKYIDIPDDSIDGQLFIPNDVYWTRGTLKKVATAQIKYHRREGNKYLWKMARVCEDRGDELIKYLKTRINVAAVEKMSKEELAAAFMGAVTELKDFSLFITIPWSLEDYLNKQIQAIVSPVVAKEHQLKVIAKLLLPIKINESSTEGPAILELAEQVDKDVKNIILKNKDDVIGLLKANHQEFLDKIDEFIEHFSWLHVRWFKGQPITRIDVIAWVKEALKSNLSEKLKEVRGDRKQVLKFVDDFANKYNLTIEQKDTIMLIKEYVFIRTYRTDILGLAFKALMPILERMATVLNLSINDILYHSEAELRDKLQSKDINVDVEVRKKSWAIMRIGNDYKVYTGEGEVNSLIEKYNISRNLKKVEKIKGQVAFPGKVRGIVKIILDPSDVSKVKKGNILVAVMTFPSYILAVEKSSALVTDEGGILCHASIIAREAKKPCVISTKIATKVFKDGDEVEVDANNGVVKIIKRAK